MGFACVDLVRKCNEVDVSIRAWKHLLCVGIWWEVLIVFLESLREIAEIKVSAWFFYFSDAVW